MLNLDNALFELPKGMLQRTFYRYQAAQFMSMAYVNVMLRIYCESLSILHSIRGFCSVCLRGRRELC